MARPSKKRAIALIRQKIERIEAVKQAGHGSPSFVGWHRDTETALRRIFGEGTHQVAQFTQIPFSLTAFTNLTPEREFRRAYLEDMNRSRAVLESMIREIEDFWPNDEPPLTTHDGIPQVERESKTVSTTLLIGLGVACFAGSITCLVPGIGHLGEERPRPGWTLLAGAWVLATIGFLLLSELHTTWRRARVRIVFSLVVAGAIFLSGTFAGEARDVPTAPSGIPGDRQVTDARSAPSPTGRRAARDTLEPQRAESDAKVPLHEEQQPPAAAEAPLVGDGATVIQETSGDSSHNIIARDVTINEERKPNAPIETYDFHGAKRISEPGRTKVTMGDQYAVFCETLSPLHQAQQWKRLAEACETQIQVAPDWLTPYLYAGEAYMHLGEREKAIERLEYVEQESAGREDYAEAKRLLEQLRETRTDDVSSWTPMVR